MQEPSGCDEEKFAIITKRTLRKKEAYEYSNTKNEFLKVGD